MQARCFLPAVPMRSEPSDRSEMVNQLLFGDTFDILEQQPNWSRIRCHYDGYEGWIDNKQWEPLTPDANPLSDPYTYTNTDPAPNANSLPDTDTNTPGPHPPISPIGPISPISPIPPSSPSSPSLIAQQQYLGAPYLWGGRTPMGIDCSGLTQVCFKACGIRLLRDASQQATQGTLIPTLEEARRDDLCFFSNDQGRIIHVGIYLGDGHIIHAHGQVRIDTLTPQGIINDTPRGSLNRTPADHQLTHRLHSIRRVL